jgi:hypothetical protein
LVKRVRATLRIAEFGFFGVVVYTRVHTPRFCGQPCNAGTLFFSFWRVRGLRTSWLTVAMNKVLQTFNKFNFSGATPKVGHSMPLLLGCQARTAAGLDLA